MKRWAIKLKSKSATLPTVLPHDTKAESTMETDEDTWSKLVGRCLRKVRMTKCNTRTAAFTTTTKKIKSLLKKPPRHPD